MSHVMQVKQTFTYNEFNTLFWVKNELIAGLDKLIYMSILKTGFHGPLKTSQMSGFNFED